MILVECKYILQKWYSLAWSFESENLWTYFLLHDRNCYWASFETSIFTEMWQILVGQAIKNGKVTLTYH